MLVAIVAIGLGIAVAGANPTSCKKKPGVKVGVTGASFLQVALDTRRPSRCTVCASAGSLLASHIVRASKNLTNYHRATTTTTTAFYTHVARACARTQTHHHAADNNPKLCPCPCCAVEPARPVEGLNINIPCRARHAVHPGLCARRCLCPRL